MRQRHAATVSDAGPAEDLARLAVRARQINSRQARSHDVLDEAIGFVDELAERFGTSHGPPSPADPHDELVFYTAFADASHAASARSRAGMRIALQRVEDALAQISANTPVREARDVNELARWIADTLADVSRARIAAILGVQPRTFARWLADTPTRPSDEDARRLRTVARTLNLLTRGLTAAGAARWFELPNPELDGESPSTTLERFDAAPRLERAAYALLAGDAS